MITPPKVSDIVLFCPVYDYIIKPLNNPFSTGGIAAIVTAVIAATETEPLKVNLTVFPDQREPVIRAGIPYRDDAASGQDYFKFQNDPDPLET